MLDPDAQEVSTSVEKNLDTDGNRGSGNSGWRGVIRPTVPILFSVISFIMGLTIVISTASIDFESAPRAPLILALKFLGFAACAIVFWHGVFYRLIIALDSESPYRGFTFRSIDYVWYFAAIISSVWVINGLAIESAKTDLVRFEQLKKPSDEYLPRNPRFKEACSLSVNLPEDHPSFKARSKQQVKNVCTVPRTGRGRSRHVPWNAFLQACTSNHFNSVPVFADDQTVTDADVFGPDGYTAIMDLYQSCIDVRRHQEFSVQMAAFQHSITTSESYPGQRSGAWLYFLAIVIGLRLTKTTQEWVDALRNAVKLAREKLALPATA